MKLNTLKDKTSCQVRTLLDVAEKLGITTLTVNANTCGDIEYLLSCDNKDFVTFHKKDNEWKVVVKIVICDFQTTEEPVYKDWYMSINYHS